MIYSIYKQCYTKPSKIIENKYRRIKKSYTFALGYKNQMILLQI